MTDSQWTTVGAAAPTELIDTTLQLHWAAQLIAAAGQTFAEPAADDSHRAMAWAPSARAFVGSPFAGAYPFRISLRPSDLTLVLVDRTGAALGSLPLAGQTLDEAHEWLAIGMATYMGGAPPVIERPEYEMPTHPVQTGAEFSTGLADQLEVLAALYETAYTELEGVSRGRADASPVLCWPHHFDIATLITVASDESGAATKTIGVGMAPMGGGYDGWYWYVTPWPYPSPDSLDELPPPGSWHTEGWTGAVLTGENLVSLEADHRAATVRRFLNDAIGAAGEALTR